MGRGKGAKVTGRFVYEWPKADVTVDCVVIGLDFEEDSLKVLLIERGSASEPFCGSWAIPGGFANFDLSLEASALETLAAKTGVRLSFLEQLYTFGDPGRDPRGAVISVAYLGLVRPRDVELVPGREVARDVRWFRLDELPELAFDHSRVVDVAVARLRSKLPWQPVGIDLLPETFTLSELQRVYEVILGHDLDKRNFRRKVEGFGVLIETDRVRKQVGRPARLFRFDRRRYRALLREGSNFEL